VLIKKAMAKMPMSLNTKKSIDEYYTTAMKKINLKMKSVEKAKKMAAAAEKAKEKAVEKARKAVEKARKAVAKPKAVKGSNTVKKPRAKKLVGGMTKQDELNLIDSIIMKFIYYNNMLVDSQQEYKIKGYMGDIKELVRLINSIGYDETNIYISNENILKSVKDDTEMDKIYRAIDDKVAFLIEKIIDRDHPETYDYYTELYNSKKTHS
jgi:hypothetical protein